MATKCTWLFRYQTVPGFNGQARAGGWSETWFATDMTPGEDATGALTRWARSRAGLLPRTTKIIGARVSEVGTGGRSRVYTLNVPGTQDAATDIPQAAIITRVNCLGTSNFRSVILRGVPDAWIVGGALAWPGVLTNALNQFWNRIKFSSWLIRCKDLTAGQNPLVSISAGGVYRSAAPNAFVDGNSVQVLRALQTSTGRRRGGVYTVIDRVDDMNGTLANWQWGAATKGAMRLSTYQYLPIDIESIIAQSSKAAVRKVGRDFFQYRGRAGKR